MLLKVRKHRGRIKHGWPDSLCGKSLCSAVRITEHSRKIPWWRRSSRPRRLIASAHNLVRATTTTAAWS